MNELTSTPAYPSKHQGLALVIGAAPTVLVDLYRVIQRLSVKPYVIALNAMASRVRCDAMVTCHSDMILELMNGANPKVIVHAYPSDQRQAITPVWGASFTWKGPGICAGTSALPAVVIAKAIGFSEVILVGCPLTKIGYLEGYPHDPEGNLNIDGKNLTATVQQRAERWQEWRRAGLLAGVTSVSGFTKDLLGEPVFERAA